MNPASIKDRLTEKAIGILERKIRNIRSLLNATPIQEIIMLRIEFKELLKKHDNNILSKDVKEFIDRAAKEEKKLFAVAKKQENTSSLISELVKYEMELSEIRQEICLKEIAENRGN